MKTLTFILGLIFAFTANSQEWENINPAPGSLSYNSLHIDENGLGIFVGFNGLISKTEDFGDTFQMLFSEVSHTLNSIDSPLEGVYTAVGDNGTIIRSINEGEDWNIINTAFIDKLNEVKYFDESVGVVVGANGTVLRTSDAGITWKKIELGLVNNITNLLIVNESVGLIWSKLSQSFFRTTNGGINWTQIDVNLGWNLNSLYFSDANNGRIFLQESVIKGQIYTTNDGGQNWSKLPQEPNRNFVSTYFLNENIGLGTTATNYVFRTQDGGLTWESEEALTFHGTKIRGNNSVIFNLRNGEIVRSEDSGITGEFISTKITTEDLRKVIFDKNNNIYLAGGSSSEGTVLVSKDGGINYSTTDFDWPRVLHDIIELKAHTIITIGEGANIMKSDDGGESWEPQYLGLGYLASIANVESYVWILTFDGIVVKSYDSGENWSVIYENPEVETRVPDYIYFLNELEGFIAYRDSRDLSYTSDGGISWEKYQLPYFTPKECLQFFDDNTAYSASDNFYKSVDKGATWEIVNSDLPFSATSMHFRNKDVGYISDFNRKIWKTQDGGLSWLKQDANFADWVLDMTFNDDGIGIAVGRNGLILRIEEGSLSSSQVQQVMELPDMGIFPNPASQEINIVSENLSDKSVLQIFNINGNLISEIKGNQSNHPIDVRDLPAGTYFILHSNAELREKGVFVKQ